MANGNGFPPRALLLTVLGAYVRRLDEWISIAGLIRLMDELGVDEQSVRSAVSRFKRRGIVVPERRGGAAGYRMSESGHRLLEEGDARIYGRPRAALLDDGWVLAVFSVPDSKRADRHALRSLLAWLGYGNLSSAVWIAPWHVEAETREALVRRGLAGYVQMFRAHYEAFGTPADLVAQSWDLAELRARYVAFQRAAAPMARRWRSQTPGGRDAFVDHVLVLSEWRPLPFLDAGLPVEALPRDWPGPRAWETFHGLVERLEGPAFDYVREAIGDAAK
ncbi:MAG TPA: PaaX family transcriptional regulator C-terminal domain-containing protein [Solirubrobacteraceae bacterium]|nr:PaaX family transcriptional regulator C-terminal domain-containing protein [Solirubrobacteraceae bacterium]